MLALALTSPPSAHRLQLPHRPRAKPVGSTSLRPHARRRYQRSTLTVHSASEPAAATSSPQGTGSDLASTLRSLSISKDTQAGKLVAKVLEEEDILGSCLILTRAFAGTPEAIGFNDATRYFEDVQKNVPRGVLYVARIIPNDPSLKPPNQDSRLIGVVALALEEDTRQPIPSLPPPPEDAYLSNMAVDPKFRRLGVGRTLLELCDQAAKAAGKPSISLHVRQGDVPATQLYQTFGYQEQARDNAIMARLRMMRPRIWMKRSLQ